MTTRDHAEVYRDADRCWRSRVVAANGNILFASSEGYSRKIDAVTVVRSRFGPIPIEYIDDTQPD